MTSPAHTPVWKRRLRVLAWRKIITFENGVFRKCWRLEIHWASFSWNTNPKRPVIVTNGMGTSKGIAWPTIMDKVLTHLSKTNTFYRRPSVISKCTFFSIANLPLFPFSILQYAPWTLSPGDNIEKGRGVRNVKTHSFNETGLFRRVSQLIEGL